MELGTVAYQLFVPVSSRTVQSDEIYETELAAENYDNSTSDGMRQAIVRISGTSITRWAPSKDQRIVEIKCRLSKGESVICGNADAQLALNTLRFFAWRGVNNVKSASNMFRNCSKLKTVSELSMSNAANTPSVFYGCTSLSMVPDMDTSHDMNMVSMFRACAALKTIPQISTDKMTVMDYAFHGCKNLTSLKLDPAAANWPGRDFSVINCNLDHTALVDLFESLPAVAESHALTISGNPGVSKLTDEERAIATEKNWVLAM